MKQHAPATQRNRLPIADALDPWLALPKGPEATVLEIASGSGEHAVYFAERFPGYRWQPSAPRAAELESIAAWSAEAALPNLMPPVQLDVLASPWPVAHADVVLCSNMIHIAPWACTPALFEGASRILPEHGLIILYGPFRIDGAHTSPSNVEFDSWLKGQNAAYGVRDLGEVDAVAVSQGFGQRARVQMPANNQLGVWGRGPLFRGA
jgi:hypothetical protein